MSYLIAPLQKVKIDFSEFNAVMKNLEEALDARAKAIWSGYTFGGLSPGDNQYGFGNIPPRHMSVPRGFGTWSFMQKYTAPGSWTNIFSYTVPNDQIHGFSGFEFHGPNQIFNALRFSISDKTFPIIEIEEARSYAAKDGMALIFKTDKGREMIVQEKISLTLKGFQERNTSGFNQRVIPIGEMAYRAKDDLVTLSAPTT